MSTQLEQSSGWKMDRPFLARDREESSDKQDMMLKLMQELDRKIDDIEAYTATRKANMYFNR